MMRADKGRLLVTGAAGFVGHAVTRLAHSEGYIVTALDSRLGGLYPSAEKQSRWESLRNLQGLSFLDEDLRTIEWDNLGLEFDYVINLAAMPGLRLSWDDYELYRSCNLDGVERLVRASLKWPLKKFIQISTSSVYGKNAIGDETQPTRPASPYGVTKLAAENLLFSYADSFQIPVAVLRYFSVYGPGQRPDMAYRKFIESALLGDPLTVYGDGTQSRTNTYVGEVARVTVDSLDLATDGEIYNISGNEERSVVEAVEIIKDLTASASPIVFEPRILGDQDRTAGDNTKAVKNLRFESSISLKEGLAIQIKDLQTRLKRGQE